jgi:pilus assembly protein CpaE
VTENIRVVVVDDIAETRDHISKLLSFETDMDVVGVAASGAEALEVATRLQPDVVLMDINMPGMDGITTTEQLSSRVPHASIVMMSVQGEADYLRRSMLAGAREFLVKPFSSDELCDSIRNVHSRELEKQGRMLPALLPTTTSQAPPGERQPGRVVTIF